METIMALVIEESEDISLELLTPILASVKKDNEVNYTVWLTISFSPLNFINFLTSSICRKFFP
jgi:hypothetical protein